MMENDDANAKHWRFQHSFHSTDFTGYLYTISSNEHLHEHDIVESLSFLPLLRFVTFADRNGGKEYLLEQTWYKYYYGSDSPSLSV